MVGKCAEAESNVVVNRVLKDSALARLDGVSLWAFCRQSPQVASVSVVFSQSSYPTSLWWSTVFHWQRSMVAVGAITVAHTGPRVIHFLRSAPGHRLEPLGNREAL